MEQNERNKMSSSFSIIIPTLNEAEGIGNLLSFLMKHTAEYDTEIIIIDGGSSDSTVNIARKHNLFVYKGSKGRAQQMNKGAKLAKNNILYFLHADTYPPENFQHHMTTFLNKGICAGCFRLRFDSCHWFLKANTWFTRFSSVFLRFGDQSLFITKALFEEIGGYDESHLLMEDQEIIYRIKKRTAFSVIPFPVTTSARKYITYGPIRLQFLFFKLWLFYQLGWSQQKLVSYYHKKTGA